MSRRSDPDTAMGGPATRFPDTAPSLLLSLQAPDGPVRQRGLAAVINAYWKPVYNYLRVRYKLSSEDAKDVTQDFFARELEQRRFACYDATRASFRTYLRVCLDTLAAHRWEEQQREKRGSGRVLSVDFAAAEEELARQFPCTPPEIEALFDREWMRSVLAAAVEALRQESRTPAQQLGYSLFCRYDLADGERPRYEDLARKHGVPVTTVTNQLAAARRRFREQVLATLRALTATEREFRAEVRCLGGEADG